MSILERVAEKAFRIAGATEGRSYSAGKNGRLVGDWNAQNNSANQEIKASLTTLRARSRQLARDNDYYIGFLKKLEANVIGTDGIRCQVNATKKDRAKREDLNRTVEDHWRKWGRKHNCDVTGQQSIRDMAAMCLRTLSVDGEFLVRLIFDPTSEFGLRLQVLDVDWLDEDYNDPKLPNGNRVVMSVELDSFDKPVAYHLSIPKWATISVPGLKIVPESLKRTRIPADQIIHRFIKERPGQARGVPWAHGAMLTLNQMDGFDESELIAARINAANMAFISPPSEEGQFTGEAATADISEVAPGQIRELPPGYTVHSHTPNKPLDGSFSKRLLRKVATSLGINYNTFTGDLEGVNFSSIRAGTIEERQVWRIMQAFIAEHFYQDVYAKWLMFNSQIVPVTLLDQVMYPIWRGKGFDWVDPAKDIKADIEAVNRGFKTMTQVIEERYATDFEEAMEQHRYEKEFIDSLGLQFTSPDTAAKLAAESEKNDENEEPKEEKEKDESSR